MQTQPTTYGKSLFIPKSDKAIQSLKATDTLQKYRDEYESGLFLFVYPISQGARKVWEYRQAPNKANGYKAKMKKLGDFPKVSHKEAQNLAHDIKENGIDNHKGATLAELLTAYESDELSRLRPNTQRNFKYSINKHILPKFGNCIAENITSPDIVSLCENLERKGNYAAAALLLSIFHSVFAYGIAHNYNTNNPAVGVRLHTRQHKVKHHAAVTDTEELAQLLKDVSAYKMHITRVAMQFMIYTGLRVNEVLKAEWWQVDFENACLTIPEEKMKRHTEHKIPLTRQTLALLESMKKYSQTGYIFKGNGKTGHRNSGTLARMVKKALGYNGTDKSHTTNHGFRSTLETTLKENMFISDIIKKMLAHGLENAVEEAYNRANYWELQKATSQWYCDYLDSLRDGTPKPEYPKGCTLNIN